jgi:hypothetical protein
MALIGATSASATTLCKVEENPCAVGNRYPSGTEVSAKLVAGNEAELKSSLGTVKCTESTSAGKTSEESGAELMGEQTSLTFSNCKLGSTKCTVTSEHLNYLTRVLWLNLFPFFHITFGNSGSGKPRALVDCGSEALKCFFGAESTLLKGESGAPAVLKAENVEFEREGGSGFLCPKESKWSATYEVTPSPLWVANEP